MKSPCRSTVSCMICKAVQQNWRNYSKSSLMPGRNLTACWICPLECDASFLDEKLKHASEEVDSLQKQIDQLTASQQKAANPDLQLTVSDFHITKYSDTLVAIIIERIDLCPPTKSKLNSSADTQ